MSNFCYANKIICEDATSNGYCSLSACRNIKLCGNTIMNEGIYPVGETKADWSKEPSNWHTGEPTEEGWYLLAYADEFYCANYLKGGTWRYRYGGKLLAWQKIEPYKED